MNRTATISRKTNETSIDLSLNLDGSGECNIETGIGFFDHMLHLFTVHGLFDITVKLDGDLEVDFHHSVEDLGICLGSAFREALGESVGIARYASLSTPMDESLSQIAVDISNRAYLSFQAEFPVNKVGEFDVELVEEFWQAFAAKAGVTLHISIEGKNAHHMIESCFKGVAQCLDKATMIDPRKPGVPSTKGVL